ncbi:hypothetical protein Riggi_40 [Bacillus phage Riggi]|uniref:Uncharacterized protein n=1 Tax=Bacillus phage Riggi TaxID=2884426 RepID=U5PZW9_9CAUD|nr:hypothetical protein Riggi_40 [Bacillus phage Riggi]AGY48202.1 hypothetical protein Riggi_40 [Bacillus phage Riggi]
MIMEIDEELVNKLIESHKEGGREQVIDDINKGVNLSREHPMVQIFELLISEDERKLSRVASTDHLLAHANIALKAVGDNNYVHIKEIPTHKEEIEYLEGFYKQSIDEILTDFAKEVEEDE